MMMNLSNKNIKLVIDSLSKSLDVNNHSQLYFVVPNQGYTDEIDYTKYRGKGRPRKTDYKLWYPAKVLKDFLNDKS